MARRNPPAKWVLPDVPDPGEYLCYLVKVPRERFHIAAFWGALYNLTSARQWQDDTAHTALIAAGVWQKLYDEVRRIDCDCGIPVNAAAGIMRDDMEILTQLVRVDGKCLFQYRCCVDDPWLTVATVDQAGAPGQPGGGSPQPAPGGGQACYDLKWDARNSINIPTVVSTGDTLLLQAASGAGANSSFSDWRCANGLVFFAGTCTGVTRTDSGDISPTDHHGQLLWGIDGTYYPAVIGTPFTVPSAITNATPILVANFTAGIAVGSYTATVCVTNNAASAWRHDFDFTLSDNGFTSFNVPSTPSSFTVWTPGTGFVGTGGGSGVDTFAAFVMPLAGAGSITKIVLTAYQPGSSPTQNSISDVCCGDPITCDIVFAASSSITAQTTPQDYTIIHSFALQSTRIYSQLSQPGSPVGSVVISSMHIEGTGHDPF